MYFTSYRPGPIGSVVFILAGLGLLVYAGSIVAGGRSEEADGADALLIIAPLGLVCVAIGVFFLPRRAPRAQPPEVAAGDGGPARVYTFTRGRMSLNLAVLLSIFLFGVGIAIRASPGVGISLAALMTVPIAFNLLSQRMGPQRLALSETSIEQRYRGRRVVVDWEAMRDVVRMDIQGNQVLSLRAAGVPTVEGTRLLRAMSRVGQASGEDMAIPLDGLRHDPEELEARIRALAGAPPEERGRLLTADLPG